MSKNTQDTNAEVSLNNLPSNEPANLGYSDLVNMRIRGKQAAMPADPEVPVVEPEEEAAPEEAGEPEATEVPAEKEGIAEEEEAAELSEDVLSNIDLSKLSPEEIDKLREVTQSRAVERFGQLTAQRKAAEQRAAIAEAKLQQLSQSKNPLETESAVENNPFSDINTLEELQAQYKTFSQIEDWAEEILDENEHASYDDIITEQDGKDLTKRQVKEYLKRARQSQKTYLPARAKELQQSVVAQQQKERLADLAKQELKWMGDSQNDVNVYYESMVNHTTAKEIAKKVPAIAPQLNYLLAHAANSIMNQKQAKTTAAKKGMTLKPPANPTSSAAQSERPADKMSGKLKELGQRYSESGNIRDFTNLRAAQIAKKRNK